MLLVLLAYRTDAHKHACTRADMVKYTAWSTIQRKGIPGVYRALFRQSGCLVEEGAARDRVRQHDVVPTLPPQPQHDYFQSDLITYNR